MYQALPISEAEKILSKVTETTMQTVLSLQSRLTHIRMQEAGLTLIGFFLLFASAQITIPLKPVPITLQTMAVMIIGLTYATRPALSAIALYLIAGALGAPIFGEWSGGFSKLIGPTGGYLAGFFVAAIFMTTWRKLFASNAFWTMFLNCALGTSLIFAFGIAWLSHFVGFSQAITLGLLPFLLPGTIKALLLCASIRYLRIGKS